MTSRSEQTFTKVSIYIPWGQCLQTHLIFKQRHTFKQKWAPVPSAHPVFDGKAAGELIPTSDCFPQVLRFASSVWSPKYKLQFSVRAVAIRSAPALRKRWFCPLFGCWSAGECPSVQGQSLLGLCGCSTRLCHITPGDSSTASSVCTSLAAREKLCLFLFSI